MEDEKKMQIILDAGNLFRKYGIKSVSMDDIARELKMSKKTLYKYVDDKNDLVYQAIRIFTESNVLAIQEIVKNAKNAIDELLEVTSHVSSMIKDIHPSIHYDLEKYYPEACEQLNDHKFNHVYNRILENIKRGIKEKLYRKDLHSEIIARIHILRLNNVFDPDVFDPNKITYQEIHKEIMTYHIRGIASEKGINYLKELEFNYD